MDPGNYGTDIQGGASLNYSLLWVVWHGHATSIPVWKDWHCDRIIAPGTNQREAQKEHVHYPLLVSC